MVGHVERFNPAVGKLAELIAEGRIGRVFRAHATRVGPLPARIQDTGVAIDLATHDLDIMQFVLGRDITRIYAEGSRCVHPTQEDMIACLLRFGDDGPLGLLDVNWLTPEKRREMTVIGEGGMLSASYLTQDVWFTESTGAPTGWNELARIRGDAEGAAVRFALPPRRAAAGRARGLRALRPRRHARAGQRQEGCRALAAALAVRDSAANSRPVTLLDMPRRRGAARASPPEGGRTDDPLRHPRLQRAREHPQPARRPRRPVARELGARVIFVDDGSTDGTAEAIEEHSDGLHLAIVRHEVNRGLGTAINSGLRAALGESSGRRRDRHARGRQHLRPRRPAADARAVRRRATTSCWPRSTRPGGRILGVAPWRLAASKAVSNAFRYAGGLREIHTLSSLYRVYRAGTLRRAAETYGYLLVREPGFAANVELLLKLYNAGAKRRRGADGQRLVAGAWATRR